ncbi:hypothetical protein HTY54_02510 [Escherichia coli]|nr:hypothetical protein [Escherichia coli]
MPHWLPIAERKAITARANAAADAGPGSPLTLVKMSRQITSTITGVNTGSGGTMLHPDGSSMNNDGMTKDEEHKNTMCKDGRCPDINKKVQTGDGINNDVDTKTDGTTQ